MSVRTFLNEASDKVTINGDQYKMKPVLSKKGDRHSAPVWHLVFFGKNKTIVLPNELTYHAGYDQGHNSGQQWYLDTEHFGSVGNGDGIKSPTTPYLPYDFNDWYVEALNGDGSSSAEVLKSADFVDHKMAIKDIKHEYS